MLPRYNLLLNLKDEAYHHHKTCSRADHPLPIHKQENTEVWMNASVTPQQQEIVPIYLPGYHELHLSSVGPD